MEKIKPVIEKFHIEYFVLISLLVSFIGFAANYYTLRTTGMIIRFNMLLDFYETRWLGGILFILVLGGHGLVLWTIVKNQSYTEQTRKFFIGTVLLMSGVYLSKLFFLLTNDNYVIHNSETSWGVTMTQHFGFAMIWLLVLMPVLVIVALSYKSYSGDGEITLLEHLVKKYEKTETPE